MLQVITLPIGYVFTRIIYRGNYVSLSASVQNSEVDRAPPRRAQNALLPAVPPGPPVHLHFNPVVINFDLTGALVALVVILVVIRLLV